MIPPEPAIVRHGRCLHLDLGSTHECLSWALIGGGECRARRISWIAVQRGELPADRDATAQAQSWLAEELEDAPAPEVVLLTSRSLDRHLVERAQCGEHAALCISTVGLSNALRPGDPPHPPPRAGTINQALILSHPLTPKARAEALALTAAARALGLCEAGVQSRFGSGNAAGTGTDCIVIASPTGARPLDWVGMHTPMGNAIGRAALQATLRGAREWLAEFADRTGNRKGERR